jgi:DNA repair protein RadC
MLDAFKTNGASPPGRGNSATRRYRLKLATWTVIREPGQPAPRRLENPAAVAELARDLVRAADDDKEHFWVVLLDAQNRNRFHTEVSIGTQSASLVHPREVFGPALREGAVALILIHNHPSGDPTPSRDDVALTRKLVECSKLLDLTIHDHVVVGNGSERYVSMAERNLL